MRAGRLAVSASGLGLAKLLDDIVSAAATALIDEHGGPVWNAEDFAGLVSAAGAVVFATALP